jgi:hypothetical protein
MELGIPCQFSSEFALERNQKEWKSSSHQHTQIFINPFLQFLILFSYVMLGPLPSHSPTTNCALKTFLTFNNFARMEQTS